MKISVEPIYTSAACNSCQQAADWNQEGLICFGASKAVVIFDTNVKDKDPFTVLCHHELHVDSVKWVRKPDGSCRELISSSVDKTAAIWTLKNGKWRVTSTLAGHDDYIKCVYGMYIDKNRMLVYTGSTDVRIWERHKGKTALKKTITLQTKRCASLHAHLLPVVKKPILFCAFEDNHKVHIFAGEDYDQVHTLLGYVDTVRALDVLDVDSETILLATGSMDIHLWRIQHLRQQTVSDPTKVKDKFFEAYENSWSVELDKVLSGYQDISGLQWHPYAVDKGSNQKVPVYRLLYSTFENSLAVWEMREQGRWNHRILVEGKHVSFRGSWFGPDGQLVLSTDEDGLLQFWRREQQTDTWGPSVEWEDRFRKVEDVKWDPRGRYLMSVAGDQTRVHAPCDRADGWREVARVTTGKVYGMRKTALVSPTTFASAPRFLGFEQEDISVFEAPQGFVNAYQDISSVTTKGKIEAPPKADDTENARWSEAQKLYGHGEEAFALAASPDGELLVSVSKRRAPQLPTLIIWETKNWNKIQTIESEIFYSGTQLVFSPDSQRLLALGARVWALYERHSPSNKMSEVASTNERNGVHCWQIMCCAWANDGAFFVTGAKDEKLCIWSKTEVQTDLSHGVYALQGKPLELTIVPTTLAFAPIVTRVGHVVALGSDCGRIRIYLCDGAAWCQLRELDRSMAHFFGVKRLLFQPKKEQNEGEALLASCGKDGFSRILRITVTL